MRAFFVFSFSLRLGLTFHQPVSHIGFDIDMIGDCDVVISELCRRAGWDLNHEMIPEREKVKVELVEGYESRYTFTPEVS